MKKIVYISRLYKYNIGTKSHRGFYGKIQKMPALRTELDSR